MRLPACVRRLLVLLLAATGFAAAAADDKACPPSPAPLNEAQVAAGLRDARDRGFLWTATQAGVTSWLYGTVHAGRADWVFPGRRVSEALASAETIALELDPTDPALQQRLFDALAARPGRELPPALRERLARRLAGECLSADTLARFAPELQVATLAIGAARRDGLETAYGTEVFLAGFARARGKAIVSLESPEEQARALLLEDPKDTAALVAAALDEFDAGRARAMTARVVRVWAEADLDALLRYDDWCECRRTPADAAAMKRLLDDRNPALAERIAALHAKGKPVFAAVGSLHMAGPNGVPALLAQRGFVVERVAFGR